MTQRHSESTESDACQPLRPSIAGTVRKQSILARSTSNDCGGDCAGGGDCGDCGACGDSGGAPLGHADSVPGAVANETMRMLPNSTRIEQNNQTALATTVPFITGSVGEDQFSVAHPLVRASPVVLDSDSFRLLMSLQAPKKLNEVLALQHFNLRRPQILETLSRFAELGLIASASDNKPMSIECNADILEVWLHLTNDCNLRCTYCYVGKNQERMSEQTACAAVDAVFRSALRHGFQKVRFKYAGGEPTLVFPLIRRLHDYIRAKSDRWNIEAQEFLLTNGVLFTAELARAVKAMHMGVSTSLDGFGDGNDVQRFDSAGTGSFRRVHRAIQIMLDNGIKPHVQVVITNLNINSLPETVSHLLEYKVPFNVSLYRDNDMMNSAAKLQLTEDQVIQVMCDAYAVLETGIPQYPIWNSLFGHAIFGYPHTTPCGAGKSYFLVDQRGRASKCQMELSRPVAHISDHDLLGTLASDNSPFQNASVDTKEGCGSCEWKYWCSGGCPNDTLRLTGRVNIKSPYCRIYKETLPRAVRLEALRVINLHKSQMSAC